MREHCLDHPQRARRSIAWGVALIVAGGVLIADRLNYLQLGPVWNYWPFLLVIAGLIDILTARRLTRAVHGLSLIVVGMWLYACLQHLWGLTFANSWPIILISIGATTLAEGLTRRKDSCPPESTR